MKRSEIVVGGIYAAKISNRIQPVRITEDLGDRDVRVGYPLLQSRYVVRHNGWTGRNVTTGREVRIKSAQRLRFACDRAGRPIAGKIIGGERQPVTGTTADGWWQRGNA